MQTYNIYEHNELQDDRIEGLQDRINAIEASLRSSKPADNLPIVLNWDTLRLLPTDVAEAVEQCKLAIIRHRSGNWEQVSMETMTSVFETLAKMTKQQDTD